MKANQLIENPGTTELRKFGLVSGTIVAALFGVLLPWFVGYDWPTWPWVVIAILWIWALANPDSLFFIYRPWLKFGHVAGWINTRIILGIMFYLVFFPVGILRRVFGNDPMARKFDKAIKSYRIASEPIEKKHSERPY